MATNSTVPTVKQRLVTVFSAATTTPVSYAWPGSNTVPECVFLGPHPLAADIRSDLDSEIPTIKAGRKQRQEEYTVRVTVWSFRPDLTSAGAEECETHAFEVWADLEDVLADDPQIGIPAVVNQHIAVQNLASTLFPFERGWACELSIDLRVRARLT